MRTITSIRLPHEAETQLAELAKSTGRSKNDLLTEAVMQYLEQETRQIARIEEGLRSADAGHVIPHDDVVWDLLATGIFTPDGLQRAQEQLASEG